jgi:hypothetical protein
MLLRVVAVYVEAEDAALQRAAGAGQVSVLRLDGRGRWLDRSLLRMGLLLRFRGVRCRVVVGCGRAAFLGGLRASRLRDCVNDELGLGSDERAMQNTSCGNLLGAQDGASLR